MSANHDSRPRPAVCSWAAYSPLSTDSGSFHCGFFVRRRDTTPLSPVEQVRRRIRKRRRSWTDPRTVLATFALLSCLCTLGFVYMRAAQGLP